MPEVSAEASEETVPAEQTDVPSETEPAEETLPVIDDHDPDPVLTMDNSQVDVSSEGVYPVTYIAQEPVASYVHYDILEVDEF